MSMSVRREAPGEALGRAAPQAEWPTAAGGPIACQTPKNRSRSATPYCNVAAETFVTLTAQPHF